MWSLFLNEAGVKHGIHNGLKLVLDVENFDYAYYTHKATGFKVALTNALDQSIVNQEGFNIAPGNLFFQEVLCMFK